MTQKTTIKPFLVAGIFSLVVSVVFAVVGKLTDRRKTASARRTTPLEDAGAAEGLSATESTDDNKRSADSTGRDQAKTTRRSPFSMTPNPMPLRTLWHRKYQWKRN